MKQRMAAIVALVGLLLLLAASYYWASRQDPVAAPVLVSTTTSTAPPPTAPPAAPVTESSSLNVERTGTTVRLEGTVQTASERDALVAAVSGAGFEADDAITVSDTVSDSDPRLIAVLLPALLAGSNDGELTLDSGTVLIRGEALDPVEAEAIDAAIDAATAGGLSVENETTVRVLPEAVQIEALQDEINQIFELARAIEGQSPNFSVSLDDLGDGAKGTLDRVTVAMRRYPLPHADIIGHTDSTGSPATNLELSEQRAQVVFDYLAGGGIAESRLNAVGLGETEPIADNGDKAGRATNRRVDFIVKSSES